MDATYSILTTADGGYTVLPDQELTTMYRVDRNNFYNRQKKSTIQTPKGVSRFLYELVGKRIDKSKPVLDPCVGEGSLLKPFDENGFDVIGIDIEKQGFPGTQVRNYLKIKKGELKEPGLVIMNPPFNIDPKTKAHLVENYGGRPLLPEVWLQKAIELFGKSIPIVLFTPYGLRLNQTQQSRRWIKFVDGTYPEICSIISLPKDVFDGILFHSEILIFNVKRLKGHYFYDGDFGRPATQRRTTQAKKRSIKAGRQGHIPGDARLF